MLGFKEDLHSGSHAVQQSNTWSQWRNDFFWLTFSLHYGWLKNLIIRVLNESQPKTSTIKCFLIPDWEIFSDLLAMVDYLWWFSLLTFFGRLSLSILVDFLLCQHPARVQNEYQPERSTKSVSTIPDEEIFCPLLVMVDFLVDLFWLNFLIDLHGDIFGWLFLCIVVDFFLCIHESQHQSQPEWKV